MELNPKLTEKGQRDYLLVQQAIHDGDRTAYSKLMGYYKDSIYFMLLKMTNNKDDAEDLTIEAFGKAFKKLAQYSPDYAFSTWLFKIASNNCIDFIRRKKQETISLDQEFKDEAGTELSQRIESDGLNPEQELIKDQKINVMRAVVKRLKPHYRVLIEMRYFRELSYEEIAAELDIPLGTVKAKLFRARDLLQNMMKDSKEII